MLAVIAIVGILAALLLPALSQTKAKAQRIQCVSNLRQAGVAFHTFLHDHNDQFPMQLSTNFGGSLEFLQASYQVAGNFYFGYRHFQAVSNELNSPKVLVCPADMARVAAENFADFNNRNLSYFLGANADYSKPNSILAGDRNVTNASAGSRTLMRLDANTVVNWTGELHVYKGNVLFADGHVEKLNGISLEMPKGNTPAQLIVPTVTPPTQPGPSMAANPPSTSAGGSSASRASGAAPGSGLDTSTSTSPWKPAAALPAAASGIAAGKAVGQGVPGKAVASIETTNQIVAAKVVPTNMQAKEADVEPRIIAEEAKAGKKPVKDNFWPLILFLILLVLVELVRRRMVKKKSEEGAIRAHEIPLC